MAGRKGDTRVDCMRVVAKDAQALECSFSAMWMHIECGGLEEED